MRFLLLTTFILTLGLCLSAQTAEKHATPEAGTKVTIGLLVDNSGSYRSIFERVVKSARSVIDGVSEGDQAFVMTFVSTSKIALRQEITDNKADLRDAVENMFIEGGPTALIDAVVKAAQYFDEHSRPSAEAPRVLVIITDGDERGSEASLEVAVNALKSSGIKVFVLGLYEEKMYGKVIDRLIKETNGAKFVPRYPKDTDAAVESLLSTIRSN